MRLPARGIRRTLVVGLVSAATSAGALAAVPITHVAAAGTLTQSWSTTIKVGPSSGHKSTVSPETIGGATIAHLFGDSRTQVIVGLQDGSVSVLDGTTGAELPGWPRYTGGPIHSNPSIADLNNDGREEIAVTSESGWVNVWNADGTDFPGWPRHSIPPESDVLPGFFGGVAIGDLFGNGGMDLVAGSWDHHVYAWDKYGNMLSGFPIHSFDTIWDTPALADLQGKGQLDIVVAFDSSGAPYYPKGATMWAFPPTGCPVNQFPDKSNCQLPGWPKLMNQVAWSSAATADLFNNGSTEIIMGTGKGIAPPAGNYVSGWTANGSTFGSWPAQTGVGRNMAAPAVGDLFGTGQRQVVEASTNGWLYGLDGNGNTLPGWPLNLGQYEWIANPSIAPINATQNGVWVIAGTTLDAFDNAGHTVWTAPGLDAGSYAAPTVGDLGNGQLSVVTVDQSGGSNFGSWTVRAFGIPGTNRMLAGAWPTFHGNGQSSGSLLPNASMNVLPSTESTTGITVSWALDAHSVPAPQFTLWVKDHAAGDWSRYGTTTGTSMAFNGYPGHTYSFAVQPGDAEPDFYNGWTSTTFAANATWATPFHGLYAVDGYGTIYGASSAPVVNTSGWPNWNIARGMAVAPGGQGGYILDGFGGLHPFGNAPAVTLSGYWPGWDIARSVVLRADGHSGYVLDGFGGIHEFGTSGDMPPSVTWSGYWKGWDIARDIQLRPDGTSGYVLDGFGGLHQFGSSGDMAPAVTWTGYWNGWDIAHRFVIDPAGTGGYVMDGFGGLHAFGTSGNIPADAQLTAYWQGWDIARGVTLLPGSTTSGYVTDGWGGFHPFGSAPAVSSPLAFPGANVRQSGIG